MWDYLKNWLKRKLLEVNRKLLAFDKIIEFDYAKQCGLVTVGKYTYGTPAIIRFQGDKNKVTIGSYCSIAEDVSIFVGGNHRVDWITTYPIRLMFGLVDRPEDGVVASKGDVMIGSDVWIGHGATILSGVEIGAGAVIGARAVVSKSVPPYAVVVGNPGRVVKKRFSDDQIKKLLEIRWWDWSEELVLDHVDLLCSSKIDFFTKDIN